VISDAHEGIKSAVTKVFHGTWQRCRVHFTRNALAHAEKSGARVISAFIASAFGQDRATRRRSGAASPISFRAAHARRLPRPAETNVLAYMSVPPQHRAKLHSTNPIERLNGPGACRQS
jgi:transposase-like protein